MKEALNVLAELPATTNKNSDNDTVSRIETSVEGEEDCSRLFISEPLGEAEESNNSNISEGETSDNENALDILNNAFQEENGLETLMSSLNEAVFDFANYDFETGIVPYRRNANLFEIPIL